MTGRSQTQTTIPEWQMLWTSLSTIAPDSQSAWFAFGHAHLSCVDSVIDWLRERVLGDAHRSNPASAEHELKRARLEPQSHPESAEQLGQPSGSTSSAPDLLVALNAMTVEQGKYRARVRGTRGKGHRHGRGPAPLPCPAGRHECGSGRRDC
jgi:hypothetical protein